MSGLVGNVSERGGSWRRIVINAPKANLLSLDMVRALRETLSEVEAGRGLKWLTIEGAGSEFSFGAKIQEHLPDAMIEVLPETHALIKQLLAFPAPTAALVDGRCLGGGFEIALACDDVIATEEAVFGLPEIRLAAFPPVAAALMPLKVGASRATRAIVTGQILPAAYWHDAGLVSLVAPQATLLDAAGSWFDAHLALHSAVALSHAALATRVTLCAQALPALDLAESRYLRDLLKTSDAQEGVRAWMAKRPPHWKDE
ncbi:MAG: enoyl-CoA hydratase/isomerase family protein [Vicinamibacterales bacterium]